MLAKGRKAGEESVQRRNLRLRLALERLTGRSLEKDFQSAAMAQGVEREADAFSAYESQTGALLDRTGFLSHTELNAGCSLDAHMGDFDWLVSIKCPIPATHWETIQSNTIPLDYVRQCVHEQWITGARGHDFVSFNPDFPDSLQLHIIPFHRVEADVEAYDDQARRFLLEVDRELQAIQTRAARLPQAVA